MKKLVLLTILVLMNLLAFAGPNEDLLSGAESGDLDKVKASIKNGADVNSKDKKGITPIMWAASNCDMEMLKLLTFYKVNINEKSGENYTALIEASKRRRCNETVLFLLKHGAEVNAKTSDEWTALMLASTRGNIEIVEMLIKYKANMNMKNKEGNNALMLADKAGKRKIVEILKNAGVEKGSYQNKKFENENLLEETKNNNIDGVKKALKFGAEIDTIARFAPDYTALMIASEKGFIDIVEILVENKANVNAANFNGWTSLMLASSAGHFKIVELLIKKNAQVNAKTVLNTTALIVAVFSGHKNIVKILIENKADLNIRITNGDYKGKTALMLAKEKDYQEIVEILQNEGAKE